MNNTLFNLFNKEEILKMKKKKDKKPEKVKLIKAEVNLLKFPFYTLDKNRFKKIRSEEIEVKKGKTIIKSWEVSPDIELGLPGIFGMKILRVIEMFIFSDLMENGKVSEELDIGSTYRICKILGIAHQSSNRNLIREAIKRLAFLGFSTENTFYYKEGRKLLTQTNFHLFDHKFKGEEFKDGRIADSNYILIAPLYKNSIENYYIKLLDFSYIKSLNSSIAIRLYEILGVKFFKIKDKKDIPLGFSYKKVCDLLPIKEQINLSRIKQQLKPALEELTKTKFLEKYILEKKGNKVFVKFYPGDKYYEDIKLDSAPKKKVLVELKKTREILKEKEDDKKYKPMPKGFLNQIQGIIKQANNKF